MTAQSELSARCLAWEEEGYENTGRNGEAARARSLLVPSLWGE